jgi:hypothetical protein
MVVVVVVEEEVEGEFRHHHQQEEPYIHKIHLYRNRYIHQFQGTFGIRRSRSTDMSSCHHTYLEKLECSYLAMVLEHMPHRSLVEKMVESMVGKMDYE